MSPSRQAKLPLGTLAETAATMRKPGQGRSVTTPERQDAHGKHNRTFESRMLARQVGPTYLQALQHRPCSWVLNCSARQSRQARARQHASPGQAGQARDGHGTAWQVLPTGVRGLELALPRAVPTKLAGLFPVLAIVGWSHWIASALLCGSGETFGIHWTFLEFGYLNLTFLERNLNIVITYLYRAQPYYFYLSRQSSSAGCGPYIDATWTYLCLHLDFLFLFLDVRLQTPPGLTRPGQFTRQRPDTTTRFRRKRRIAWQRIPISSELWTTESLRPAAATTASAADDPSAWDDICAVYSRQDHHALMLLSK